MTHRESTLSTKDLELLKNLPNLAEKINQNMKTMDNLINTQRELNSSLSSINSSNNGLRGLGHSKGKNRKLNLEEAIDIKNIVKQSLQGLNNIFDKEIKSENVNKNNNKNMNKNNPLAISSDSSLGNLSKEQILNQNFAIGNSNSSNNVGGGSSCLGIIKGKNFTLANSTNFEPIEEENNLGNNDFATKNFSKFISLVIKKFLSFFKYVFYLEKIK